MTRRSLIFMLLCAALGAGHSPAPDAATGGSTVRGRLYRLGPRGEAYAAQGVAVRLNHQRMGPSSFVYSDGQGMWALSGIPAGDFVLEIWISQTQTLRYQIRVLAQEYTDIAPIRVP